MEQLKEGLAGRCRAGVGSPAGILGAMQYPCPATETPSTGEKNRWGTKTPRPTGSRDDQDTEHQGGLSEEGVAPATASVSAGASQAGWCSAWLGVDSAFWTLKAPRHPHLCRGLGRVSEEQTGWPGAEVQACVPSRARALLTTVLVLYQAGPLRGLEGPVYTW